MQSLAALLAENELPNLAFLLIEPHRGPGGGWRVKFNYESSEPLSMKVEQASVLVERLKMISEMELAAEVDDAVKRVLRYNRM